MNTVHLIQDCTVLSIETRPLSNHDHIIWDSDKAVLPVLPPSSVSVSVR